MATSKFSTKNLTVEVINNNPAISEFLNMGTKAQKFYTTLADVSIGLNKKARREINRTLKGDFNCTKEEAFIFLNFVKRYILAA
jgi:hypothetical protein